jgi:hypothetical protein
MSKAIYQNWKGEPCRIDRDGKLISIAFPEQPAPGERAKTVVQAAMKRRIAKPPRRPGA